MRHEWEKVESSSRAGSPFSLHFMPERRCKNCGKWQRKESDYDVMRGYRYAWRPLAGRCKPENANGNN